MGFSEKPAVWTDREPTLDEEVGALDEEDIFEMANLTEDQTGIAGIVFISTVMGAHGPRVKYFLKTGPGQPSFSVSVASEPRVVASSLPDRDFARMAPPVLEWVRLNHEALARFWWEGKILDRSRGHRFQGGPQESLTSARATPITATTSQITPTIISTSATGRVSPYSP